MTQNQCENKGTVLLEPFVAGILSFFFMGLGQAYNGQRRKGYLYFLSYLGMVILYIVLLAFFHERLPKNNNDVPYNSPSYLITVFLGLLIWLGNIIDAYKTAKRLNREGVASAVSPGRSSFIFLRNCLICFLIFLASIIIIGLISALFFSK